MSLGMIFVIALVAFILIILFLSWYTKFVMYRIFGKMNDTLSLIIHNGITPAVWDKKLLKAMHGADSNEKKEKAFKNHLRYLDGEFINMRNFAEKSSFIEDDHKEEIVDALAHFKAEYIEDLTEKLGLENSKEP